MKSNGIIKDVNGRMEQGMYKIESVTTDLGRCEKSRLLAIAKTHIETASLYLEKALKENDNDDVDLTTKSYCLINKKKEVSYGKV
jgi:hypothetical protein